MRNKREEGERHTNCEEGRSTERENSYFHLERHASLELRSRGVKECGGSCSVVRTSVE